jgi:2-polyprenyl-6-methoxyphenol hydroxylase-like FAD-dependent oxidoreductase
VTETETEVLVVGGGPVGLTLAIALGQQGVSVRLVERRAEVGRLPKMERCNARTMELFRRLGIAELVRAEGLADDVAMDVFICLGDLTREPLVHHRYPSVREAIQQGREVNDGSLPLEPYQLISQYTLEPLLRRVADATPGVHTHYGSELVNFTQDEDGVRAQVRDSGGIERDLWCRYLVGADGGSSTVRQRLGIELRGESLLTMRQALFRCDDLFDRIPIGKGRHYHFADNRSSFLIVQDDRRHFSLHATVDSDAEMPALFESVVGMPITYETLYVGTWTQRLMLADRYRDRRVFLAGDAAHLMIPTGGLGMNTGAGDAADLAWKLAAVLRGWGGEGLLDAYQIERRKVGERAVAASRKAATGRRRWRSAWRPEITENTPRGAVARARFAAIADREQRWSNDLLGIELGYRYVGSPLIVGEPGQGPDLESFAFQPTTWPGARLPHLWLADGSPIQDHLGHCYTMLHRPGTTVDPKIGAAFRRYGVPYATFEVHSPAAAAVYGDHPLLLLRPDLHVAWRGGQVSNPDALAATVSGHRGRSL